MSHPIFGRASCIRVPLWSAAVLTLLYLGVSGFGRLEGTAPGLLDAAGVRIVDNVSQDRELNWQLEEVLRIGGHDQGPEALVRVDPDGIATDSAGRLYVLDMVDPAVHVFDTAGEHVRTLGRRGPGPGELMRPAALYVTASGEIRVLDTEKRAFVRFGAEGSVEMEVRLPDVRADPAARTEVLATGELVMAVGSGATCPGCPHQTTIQLFPPTSAGTGWAEPVDLAVIAWAQPTSFNPVGAEGCPKWATPPVFWRYPVWRLTRGALLYNRTDSYVIDKLPDILASTPSRQSIRRDFPVMAATPELAAAEIGPLTGEFQGVSCNASAEERAAQAGWAEHIPWILDATLGPDGKHYVQRRAPGLRPPSRIDVFYPDGEYLGTLPSTFPFPTTWRRDDEIVVVEHDYFHQPYVVVYRVREQTN